MKPILIGLAGVSASGKTLVAKKIAYNFKKREVRIIKLDDYYKDQSTKCMEDRIVINYDHPEAFDFELLCEHLSMLSNGESIEKPVYNFAVHNRADEHENIEPSPIIILEGILVLNEALRDLLELKIYVDADSDECFIRRLQRDIKERGRAVDDIIAQYQNTVKPMQEQFIEPTKKYADIIIPNPDGKCVDVAIDIIKSMIQIKLDK